jgi:hypothetical protein
LEKIPKSCELTSRSKAPSVLVSVAQTDQQLAKEAYDGFPLAADANPAEFMLDAIGNYP